MKKITISNHSQIRYSERIGYRDEIKSIIPLVRKYGLKKKHFPKTDIKNRKYMENKIYYEGNIYVFSSKNYKKLVTVYKNTRRKEVFERLYQIVSTRKRELLAKEDKTKYKQTYTTLNNTNCSFVLNGKKIVQLKAVDKVEYKYERYGLNKELTNIFSSIAKYLRGECMKPLGDVDLENYPKKEKIVYKEIMRIPYGQSLTYSELLKKVNKNYDVTLTLQQLTGMIKRCPILFLIPTHRVIRKDGKLGCFCTNKNLKEKLVSMEKSVLEKNKKPKKENKYKNRFSFNLAYLFL